MMLEEELDQGSFPCHQSRRQYGQVLLKLSLNIAGDFRAVRGLNEGLSFNVSISTIKPTILMYDVLTNHFSKIGVYGLLSKLLLLLLSKS